MREIVFDTETTGLDPASGDRVVEIGAIELLNHIPTGQTYHVYLNPERPVAPQAFDVHGLSDDFLSDKALFAAVADAFRDFLGDARLIAHNAFFDLGFLNAEFARTGHPAIPHDRILDSLALARRKHPGASNTLDALCTRYGIDTARRVKHGALLDSELLAEVYIELIGGRQTDLGLAMAAGPARSSGPDGGPSAYRTASRPDLIRLTEAEIAAHAGFVATLGGDVIWRAYLGDRD